VVKELPVEKSIEEDIPYFNLEPIGALDKIPIQENYDPMVDIREFCPEVDVAESVRYPFLRRRVAEMLNQAQSYLPPDYKLSISGGYSCYRPLEQQAKAYWRFYKRAKEEHPNWPESAVRRHINRGIHPPDAKTPPGHSTGAAIDIGIIDPEGNPLDMRSLAKGVKPEQARRTSDTLSNKVSPEARANRLMLLRAMA
jgi:D-alanyl-D-alanine dipeptidase